MESFLSDHLLDNASPGSSSSTPNKNDSVAIRVKSVVGSPAFNAIYYHDSDASKAWKNCIFKRLEELVTDQSVPNSAEYVCLSSCLLSSPTQRLCRCSIESRSQMHFYYEKGGIEVALGPQIPENFIIDNLRELPLGTPWGDKVMQVRGVKLCRLCSYAVIEGNPTVYIAAFYDVWEDVLVNETDVLWTAKASFIQATEDHASDDVDYKRCLLLKNGNFLDHELVDFASTDEECLFVAAKNGFLGTCQLLVKRGVNLRARRLGKSSLEAAWDSNHSDIVQFLLNQAVHCGSGDAWQEVESATPVAVYISDNALSAKGISAMYYRDPDTSKTWKTDIFKRLEEIVTDLRLTLHRDTKYREYLFSFPSRRYSRSMIDFGAAPDQEAQWYFDQECTEPCTYWLIDDFPKEFEVVELHDFDVQGEQSWQVGRVVDAPCYIKATTEIWKKMLVEEGDSAVNNVLCRTNASSIQAPDDDKFRLLFSSNDVFFAGEKRRLLLKKCDPVFEDETDFEFCSTDEECLFVAAKNGLLRTCQFLVKKGVKLMARASGKTPLEVAWDSNHFEIVKFLLNQAVHCGSGDAWPEAENDTRVATAMEWFEIPMAGFAGRIGIRHSVLRIVVGDATNQREYALEKASLPIDATDILRDRLKNGVLISDWSEVGPLLVGCKPARSLASVHMAEHHTIGSLREIAIRSGPYNVSTTNCHHAAFDVYNVCAMKGHRAASVPNAFYARCASVLKSVGLDVAVVAYSQSGDAIPETQSSMMNSCRKTPIEGARVASKFESASSTSQCLSAHQSLFGFRVGQEVTCIAMNVGSESIEFGTIGTVVGFLGNQIVVKIGECDWSMSPTVLRSLDWMSKAQELAKRGIQLGSLLDFYSKLGTPSVMPHFDPEISTTSDVVRHAIIPLSWSGSAEDHGTALAPILEHGPLLATHLVSHTWTNRFAYTIAAMVATALDIRAYDHLLPCLLPDQLPGLRKDLEDRGRLTMKFWFCAVSVNQHDSICGGFSPPPAEEGALFQEWDTKRRDSVTGQVYPTCACRTPKHMNDSGWACELNKFDDMMRCMVQECSEQGLFFISWLLWIPSLCYFGEFGAWPSWWSQAGWAYK